MLIVGPEGVAAAAKYIAQTPDDPIRSAHEIAVATLTAAGVVCADEKLEGEYSTDVCELVTKTGIFYVDLDPKHDGHHVAIYIVRSKGQEGERGED